MAKSNISEKTECACVDLGYFYTSEAHNNRMPFKHCTTGKKESVLPESKGGNKTAEPPLMMESQEHRSQKPEFMELSQCADDKLFHIIRITGQRDALYPWLHSRDIK